LVPCGDGRDDKKLRASGYDRIKMLKIILNDIIDPSVPIKVNDLYIKLKQDKI
jgi:hypothetical protein